MGFILNERHDLSVELRRESFCVNEILGEDGEKHVYADENSDGTVSLEISYDFMKRLLRFIDGNEHFFLKMIEAEQKRLT